MASQQNIDAWWAWATGVLHGIGAPTNAANFATLWNWSIKESGQDPIANGRIRNNPLNTTQRAPGSTSQNSVGVQSFPDISTGVAATVQTLQNGRYPQIVANLRNSVPSYNWLAAGGRGTPSTAAATTAQLNTWGSKTNWLSWTNKPPTPSQNFQTTAGVSSLATNPDSNPVSDALNSALGSVGTAITGAEQNFVQAATNYFLMGVGVLFMLGGLALIAVMTLRVPTPVRQAANVAASVTPAGRVVSAAKAASPPPAKTPAAPVPAPKVAAPQSRAERSAQLEKGMSEGRSFGQLRRRSA